MLRFICVVFIVITFLILSIPLLIAEWIVGFFNMDLKNRSSLAIVNWAFGLCIKMSGVTTTVIGEENVPKDQAVLYVGNHRSYFDILLTYVRVKGPTGYVAKIEMLRWPLLSNWMKNLHCLFLDRSDIKKGLKTILDGVNKLKSGISIFIFPEGTRNKTEDNFLPFKDGSFKIAEKANALVIPVTLNNTRSIFEAQFPKIRKSHVVIEYGKPININELSKEERKNIGAYVQGIMEETYNKNKALV